MGGAAETARRKFPVVVRWLKANPIISIIGIIGTVSGAVISIAKVIPVLLSTFDVPDCFTYAKLYRGPTSYFSFAGNNSWTEYQSNGSLLAEFRELHRTREHIDLLNITPRVDPRATSMIVRLPVCGGTAKWTYQNPEYWTDLFEIWRG